jgi:hypothetical protein
MMKESQEDSNDEISGYEYLYDTFLHEEVYKGVANLEEWEWKFVGLELEPRPEACDSYASLADITTR